MYLVFFPSQQFHYTVVLFLVYRQSLKVLFKCCCDSHNTGQNGLEVFDSNDDYIQA